MTYLRSVSAWLIIVILSFSLPVFGCSKASTDNSTSTSKSIIQKDKSAPKSSESEIDKSAPSEPSTSSESSDTISWSKAADYIGDKKTVTGQVVDTKYASSSNGQPTFLNLGKSYPNPDRFTVVIWSENRSNFSSPPENYYEGKTINVTGLIDEYQGIPQIEVTDPDQIEEK